MLVISIKNQEDGKNKKGVEDKVNVVKNTNINNVNDNNTAQDENDTAQEELYANKKIHRVDSENEYYTVEKSLRNYLLYSKVGNEKAINSISNGETIFDRNVASGKMTIENMYAIDNDEGTTYFIDIQLSGNSYYIVFINDFTNGTFRISNLENQEYNNIINGGSSLYEEHISVSKNEYNSVQHVNLNNSEIVEKYFKSYIQNAIYNSEKAYMSLDEDYRNARFGSYQNFREYLEEPVKERQLESFDQNSIKDLEDFENEEEYREYMANLNKKTLKNYEHVIDGGKEYYICIDAYDNIYIFEIDGVMNYKLYLDTYTIELEYFTKRDYNEETINEDKAKRNTEKVFEALNSKDYEYVYKKLDDKIKDDVGYDEFIQYMKQILFNNNHMEFDEVTDENDVYSCKIIITDNDGKNIEERTMTIEIELTQVNEFIIRNIKI